MLWGKDRKKGLYAFDGQLKLVEMAVNRMKYFCNPDREDHPRGRRQLGPWLTSMVRLLTTGKKLKHRERSGTSRAICNSWKRLSGKVVGPQLR